jgi:hypothetical protein
MAVHHQRDAALGERADFGDRQRDIIRRHRHRFGVEVTAGDDVIFGGKDQRVIGDRVGFGQQHFRRLADLRQAGAHHLRLAAQEYGSCTLLQLWCDCEIALSSVSRWRYSAAASICPRWPRTS